MGYRIGELEVTHHPREHGKSKYGPGSLAKGFYDLLRLRTLYYNNNNGQRTIRSRSGLPMGASVFLIGFFSIFFNQYYEYIDNSYILLAMAMVLILFGIVQFSYKLLDNMLLSMKTPVRNYTLKEI
jgi:hypothetical protein